MPCCLLLYQQSCETETPQEFMHYELQPSGGGLETQVPCEVLASNDDIQQDWHRYFAGAFNALCCTCLWHTHTRVAHTQLSNLGRAGANSSGALWCPSSPPSPETVKSSQWNNFCALAWHRCIWSWVGSAIFHGAMVSRLSVCYHVPCYSCISVCTCTSVSAPHIPFILPFAQKPVWIDIGCTLLVLWREKGHPRYKRSFQNNKVITINLDTAQLSSDCYNNFIILTYYRYLAYLL